MEEFFSKYKKIHYGDKEVIIRAEDNPLGVYYVKSGFVRMDANFENGTEVTFNIFKPGSFFPTAWAIGDVDNSYSFISMGQTELYRAPKEEFLDYLKSNPELLFDLTRRLLVGMEGLLDGVKNVIKGSAREKVLWALTMLEKRGINIKLTHQDIARIAVVTRETASVEIKKLEKEKIISFKKGIIEILDRKDSSF